MIIEIGAVVLLTCATPMFFNDTEFVFNKHDKVMYERNSTRCGKGGYSDTPCVKYFKKVGERDYHLVCTEGTRRSNE
jgi:hypothetical protein